MVARASCVLLVEIARVLALVKNSLLIGLCRSYAFCLEVDDRSLTTLIEWRIRCHEISWYSGTAPALSIRSLERTSTNRKHLDGIVTTCIAVVVWSIVELHGQDVLGIILTGISALLCPASLVASFPFGAGTIPKVLVEGYERILTTADDILQAIQHFWLGYAFRFLAIDTSIK